MVFPNDITKPFFSYGIFRPGEIAYNIISEFVDLNKIEKRAIKGTLKLRDGIAFFDDEGDEDVEGYLLFFKEGCESRAYELIVNVDLGKRYIWCKNGPVSHREFNILVEKKDRKMNLPKDLSKPFFSYGIFRPGEIAYNIISEFVDLNKIEKRVIKGTLKLRDGILIYDQKGVDDIDGYVLFFKEGLESKAYDSIVKLEPGNYYMWNDNESKYRKEFNILHGKNSEKGIDEEKKFNYPKVWNNLFESIWRDPFIINGFNMLDQYAIVDISLNRQYKEIEEFDEGSFNDYLKYQMLYLFLSSILERIMFLNGGFGINPNKQKDLFSKDKTLIKVLDQIVNNEDFPQFKSPFERVIHPTNDPDSAVKWSHEGSNKINAKKAMDYYYQLRSNITHRGKTGMKKHILLKESFEELKYILRIFWSEKETESKKLKEEIDNLIVQRDERN
jgi:hypothetical protein